MTFPNENLEPHADGPALHPPTRNLSASQTLIAILLIAAIYFISGTIGLSLAFLNKSATAVWPPTGLSIAAIILFGRRVWPGIFLGALLTNLYTTPSIGTSLGIAAGNTAEALVGAALVIRFARGRNAFDRARDVAAFVVLAGLIATAISATIGPVSLIVGKYAHWQNFWPIWFTWWLGDGVSAAVIAPLVIVWAKRPLPRLPRGRLIEATCLSVLLIVVCKFVFAGGLAGRGGNYPLGYLGIPLLLWASFRFRQHGAVTGVAIMSAIAIHGTLNEVGPFATGEANTSFLFLQTFMATVAVTALILSAVVVERDRTEQSLRRSRAEAVRATKAKDEFIAVLSHELRTPLSPVLLTISMLESQTDLSPQIRRDVEMIRRNVELESQLIGDLLDLTRIARGKLQLELKQVDVHQLISAAADICTKQGLSNLRINLSSNSHHVTGDSARLQQIFWNLISNAQKFTPAGGEIFVRTSDLPGDRIRIEVSDTGVGIAPDLLPKLFNAFEQGDIKTTRQFGGLGLGLAISKKLVVAHGGTISAQSEGHGKGSTFTIELQTVTPSSVPATSAPVQANSSVPPSMTILLVEDHEPTSEIMSRLLRRLGHRVTTASTLAAATRAVHSEQFNLLISDLGLPDGSGLELMRQLRDQYAGRAIALTGYGMPDDIQKSHDAGFAAHLTKPIDFKILQSMIEEMTTAKTA